MVLVDSIVWILELEFLTYAVAIYALQKLSFNQHCNAMGNYNVL